MEKKQNKDGSLSKVLSIKLTESGNPFTHSLDYLAKKLAATGALNKLAKQNIDALREIRDSSVHFYNRNSIFAVQLQEVGTACVKNFVQAVKDWFDYDLSRYNFYLMPLAFIGAGSDFDSVSLNKEERNLTNYISALDEINDPNSEYAVSVNVELKFLKSKAKDALAVQITNDPNATKLQLTETQWKERYPLNYEKLITKCKARYSNFLVNKKFHVIKSSFKDNPKYSVTKVLDPDNPKSVKQDWYSESVFSILDNDYTKK